MKTKDRIVESARQLFNQEGTKSVTTNHIAEEAGISPGNLYYHFRNKEEIIRAIFLKMVHYAEHETSYGSGGFVLPSLGHLERLFKEILNLYWEYRFFFRELNVLLNRDPELKTAFQAMQRARIKEITDSMRAFMFERILKQLDEETLNFLARSFWIISTCWLSYLETDKKKITRNSIEEGLSLLRHLLKPYLEHSMD